MYYTYNLHCSFGRTSDRRKVQPPSLLFTIQTLIVTFTCGCNLTEATFSNQPCAPTGQLCIPPAVGSRDVVVGYDCDTLSSLQWRIEGGACRGDDDDEGRINFSLALSPKTTRTRNNKPKQ